MKKHIQKLLVVIILACGVVSSRAGILPDDDVKSRVDFERNLTRILDACNKIAPGMTRAALTNDFTSYHIGNITGYLPQDHYQYSYRGCFLIKIDVDFVPTSKAAQPTDIIAKISKPYIESSYP
jgi:hypothetical protein